MTSTCSRPLSLPATFLAVGLGVLFVVPSLFAQSPDPGDTPQKKETFTGTAQVTAVDLLLEVRGPDGEVPDDLRPQDFEVLEDGAARPVVGVEVFGPRRTAGQGTAARTSSRKSSNEEPGAENAWTWRIVVYIDQVLSSSRSIRRTCEALAAQAGRLADLGTVEVVVASPRPQEVLPPTRSARLIEQTLSRLARETTGRDALRHLRRQYLSALQVKGEIDGTGVPTVATDPFADTGGATTGQAGRRVGGRGGGPTIRDGSNLSRRRLVRSTIPEEVGLLRGQHDAMMAWLSSYSAVGARALVMVNDGYDLDPAEFYLSGISPGSTLFGEINADLQNLPVAPGNEELAQQLSASGWVTLGVMLGGLESGATMAAEISGKGRVGDLVAGRNDTISSLPGSLVLRPLGPIDRLARETGGEVLTGAGKIPGSLERLGERVRLTYQVGRTPDGELHRIEVRPRREGLKIKAPKWSGSPAPEVLSAARTRGLLRGDGERGGLPLTAAVALQRQADEAGRRKGRLQARVDLEPIREALAAAGDTPLRVTFGVSFPDDPSFVHHDLVTGRSLAGLDVWTYGTPLSLPAEADKVAVVFEELTTGAWGGVLAARVEEERAAAPEDDSIPDDLLPGRRGIFLLPPGGDVVIGKERVEAAVANPAVRRVDFHLDGERVASRDDPPWEARVDFGRLPEPRRIEVVAYGEGGVELGRDARQVNSGVGRFGIRLIEPRSGRRTGWVDVEAEVTLPADGELDRVELFWSGERTATLYEAPFRQRFEIPAEAPAGYLTAVAYDRAGSRVEDVVFLNGEGAEERVEVQLVELFTVVTGEAGRPVQDVAADELAVFENGAPQEINGFRPGVEMPLKLGLLLDTSASMTPSMGEVQRAAIDFLLLALKEEDRAFVVDFKEAPRMAQELTGDRRALVGAVSQLTPGGTSALCDALVYSLVQMQEVDGRRALVVLSDGVGRNERVNFTTCLRFVQRNGIPVYGILLAGDDPTAEREGTSMERLGRIAESVGGRVWRAEEPSDLGGIYRSLIDELRSQVLVTYAPPFAEEDDWRVVHIEVERPGHQARTRSGYYP